MRGGGLLCVWLTACGVQVGNGSPGGGDDDVLGSDSGWSEPVAVPGASSPGGEDDPTLSSTMLELIFSYEDPTDGDNKHLYAMTRATAFGAWSAPERLPFNARGSVDQTPRLFDDDRTLYFASDRDGGTDGLDIWRVTRPAVGARWGQPEQVDELVDPDDDDKWFAPCDGGRYLMISQRGKQGDDIYEGVLGAGPPRLVPELTSMRGETGPFLSRDCLTIHFASQRAGDNAIYSARRATIGDRWSEPRPIEAFSQLGGDQEDPWLSADGAAFVFVSNVAGSKDVYLSTR